MKDIREKDISSIKSRKGSLTVEASLVLPLFISVIITIAFFMKLVYTHEVVQHALDQTANELATYSYIYSISGVKSSADNISNSLKEGGQQAKEDLDTVVKEYNLINNLSEKAAGTAGAIERGDIDTTAAGIEDIQSTVENLDENTQQLEQMIKRIAEDPVKEVKSVVCLAGSLLGKKANHLISGNIVKLFMIKNLKTGYEDTDKRLASLNIEGGIKGMNFYKSLMFGNEGKDEIDAVVQYKVKLPVPFNFIGDINMEQRASVRAWLDDKTYTPAQSENSDPVWSKPQFPRGQAIQEKYKPNLPDKFQTICRFENGKATAVHSIDLRADSYNTDDGGINTGRIRSKVGEYTNSIYNFKGYELTSNGKKYVVKENDIQEKELIIVVPKGSIKPDARKAMDDCIREADAKGVKLRFDEL